MIGKTQLLTFSLLLRVTLLFACQMLKLVCRGEIGRRLALQSLMFFTLFSIPLYLDPNQDGLSWWYVLSDVKYLDAAHNNSFILSLLTCKKSSLIEVYL